MFQVRLCTFWFEIICPYSISFDNCVLVSIYQCVFFVEKMLYIYQLQANPWAQCLRTFLPLPTRLFATWKYSSLLNLSSCRESLVPERQNPPSTSWNTCAIILALVPGEPWSRKFSTPIPSWKLLAMPKPQETTTVPGMYIFWIWIKDNNGHHVCLPGLLRPWRSAKAGLTSSSIIWSGKKYNFGSLCEVMYSNLISIYLVAQKVDFELNFWLPNFAMINDVKVLNRISIAMQCIALHWLDLSLSEQFGKNV